MQVLFCVIMFVFGAALGSFLCCQAHRLHLKEIKKKSPGSRSVCLHCGHRLKWYENLPIISWLIQKGKCKKCDKKIGYAEIISEFSTALAFVILATTINIATATPADWTIFILTVFLTLTLIFLAIYDGKWGELPVFALIISAIFAIILAIFKLSLTGFAIQAIFDTIIAALILGGLYLVLYLVSKGKWVGDGDWLLAGIIGISLGAPFTALIALFVSNFSACIIMAPTAFRRKKHQIYFGPFLVLAYVITLALCGIIKL